MRPPLRIAGALGFALIVCGCFGDKKKGVDTTTESSTPVSTGTAPAATTPASTDPQAAPSPTPPPPPVHNDSGKINVSHGAAAASHVQVNDSGQISIKGIPHTTKK